MSVYIDYPMDWGWKYGKSCHLIADTLEELHKFAASIGLKRCWFQNIRIPHYDLTMIRRIKAINKGAIELGRAEFVEKIRSIRTKDMSIRTKDMSLETKDMNDA